MIYLADTHILIWSWHAPDRLSPEYTRILNSDAKVMLSIASIWEISIKSSVGKLTIREDVARNAVRTGYTILPISVEHAESVARLPLHHRDPFDRMLVAQARCDGLALMTADDAIRAYDVKIA
ncbi:MAG: type II toxin-antitoxin system VapC family toxin [Pikeienuella sp.]